MVKSCKKNKKKPEMFVDLQSGLPLFVYKFILYITNQPHVWNMYMFIFYFLFTKKKAVFNKLHKEKTEQQKKS